MIYSCHACILVMLTLRAPWFISSPMDNNLPKPPIPYPFNLTPEERETYLAKALKNPVAKLWYEKLLVGSAIKKARLSAGMTQKDFAKKLKTSQSAVARLEQGQQNITLDMLVKIAHVLNRRLQIKIV